MMAKKILAFLCITLLSIGASSARKVVDLNRGWTFFHDYSHSTDDGMVVVVPHTWNNDALGGQKNYYRGNGNYIKDIDIPQEWKNKRLFIRCNGANSVATLMVNRKLAGEHRGGYTSFTFEITDLVQFGRSNNLRFMVNNSPSRSVLPIAGDQNEYGGLIRDVELIVTDRNIISLNDNGADGIRIIQSRVSEERAIGEAIVKIDALDEMHITIDMTILNPKGEEVATGSAKIKTTAKTISTTRIPFSIDKPRLWNGTIDPALHSFKIKISDGKESADSLTVKSGFRSMGISSQGEFLLNGKVYKIKGVVVTQDRAVVGSAIQTYDVKEDFNAIKDMGANAVRVARTVHHPEFYRLCDQAGILVWSEFPLAGASYLAEEPYVNSNAYKTNAKTQAAEIISQHFNHPSVVMWGLFSNFRVRGENPVPFISELNAMVKKEDPSRYTVAASNDDGEINFVSDLIVWNHVLGWQEGQPSDIQVWQRQYHREWGNLKSAVSYSIGGSIYHQEVDSLQRPAYLGNWHPEQWQTFCHREYYKYLRSDNQFWGVFVGNMFDYGASGRSWGDGSGTNDCGLVTFDRKHKKDAYYFYKANWNSKDRFIYISERRLDKRAEGEQTFDIFTNSETAELIVNGESKGIIGQVLGVISWRRVDLKRGLNVVQAMSCDGAEDMVEIYVY